jgi:tetratricopeptide (TPR) repeat protein
VALGAAATCLFAAALLSKPSAAALTLMVLSVDLILLKIPASRTAPRLASWFVLAGASLILMRSLQPPIAGDNGPLWTRALVAIDSLVFYLGKLVSPVGLSADYSRTPGYVLSGASIRWLWIVPACIAGLLIWKPRRVVLACVSLFVLGLLPVLGLVPFEFQRLSSVADRYAYFALIGPAVAIGVLVLHRTVWMPVALGLLLLLGWRSHVQLATWRDDVTLWSHAARVNPRPIVAISNLAVLAAERGDTAEARRLFERMIELDPRRSNGYIGVGSLLMNGGDVGEAVLWFGRAIDAEPTLAEPRLWMGDACRLLGDVPAAEACFAAALDRQPDSVEAMYRLAQIRFQAGRLHAAQDLVECALAIHPRHVPSWMQRADLLAVQGDTRGYIDAMNAAVRFAGADPAPLDALGRFAMKIGDWNAAIDCFERSLRRVPDRLPIMVEYGTALARVGRFEESIGVLERARALAPDEPVVLHNLRTARDLRQKFGSSAPTGQEPGRTEEGD